MEGGAAVNSYQTGIHQPRESRSADTEQAYHDTQMAQFQKDWDAGAMKLLTVEQTVSKLSSDPLTLHVAQVIHASEFDRDEYRWEHEQGKLSYLTMASAAVQAVRLWDAVHRPYATGE